MLWFCSGLLFIPGDCHHADFGTLVAQVAAYLIAIGNGDFKNVITRCYYAHAVINTKMFSGRRHDFLTFQHVQINVVESSALEFSDIMALEMHGERMRGSDTDLGNTLLGMTEHHDDTYIENIYRELVKKSKQFAVLYTQLEADRVIRGRPRSDHDLHAMARHHLGTEIRAITLRTRRYILKLVSLERTLRATAGIC